MPHTASTSTSTTARSTATSNGSDESSSRLIPNSERSKRSMASDTATALPERSSERPARVANAPSAFDHSAEHRHGRLRLLSPITLRILAVNVLALALLAGGILFLGQYERGLIESELGVLRAQSRLLGVALAEGALDSRSEGP